MHGKLIFKYGCMGSGKSLLLLATAYNFQQQGISFLILKSEIDKRDGENVIHSRALGDRECLTITEKDNIFNLISELRHQSIDTKSLSWILVDEAQFLTPEQVEQLAAVADNFGINVICYGLRTDFKTNLFPGSKRLFEIADSFEEIKASCSCNSKTIFNARVNENKDVITDGEQVEVGGDERYIAMCRRCYFEKIQHPLYKKKNKIIY